MQYRRNVLVADGLRVHICPKVASASISAAMIGVRYNHTFTEEEGPEYRWMVVRHPLDRLVSCWAFFCNSETPLEIDGQHDIKTLGYRYGMPFDEFLDIAIESHAKNAHTEKQILYAGNHKFDRLCRLENIAAEWSALRKRFLMLKRPLIVTHQSKHGHWSEYYSDLQSEKAMNVFAEDLELYHRADKNPPVQE